LGKYHPDANSDAVADANTDRFAIANSDSRRERSIDIFAFWFAGSIAFRDVRLSDLECDARPVNTSAARANRVLLMQLHAAFTGLKGNEFSHETLVVLAAHHHRSRGYYCSYLSRDLGARLR
jgi:hypothetical protein